jgi:fructose-bisphosphate aldolase class II
MSLVGLEVLSDARQKKYGVLSLLAGNLEMVIGYLRAAEEQRAPLILAFTPPMVPRVPVELGIPMLVNAARRAAVPVAVILDHGDSLEAAVRAMQLGASAVMYDGSSLPYAENVANTCQVVRVAHALGVSVEAELGSVGGNAVETGRPGGGVAAANQSAGTYTDPEVAVDFVARTGVDALAISFGNAHGVYQGEPRLDLERVRQIRAAVEVPLVMHGASGLAYDMYPKLVESGISKVCYYSALGLGAGADLRRVMERAGEEPIAYHHLISWAVDYFHTATKQLMDVVGCAGAAAAMP